MTHFNTHGLVALGLVLAATVGGALGALALGESDLALAALTGGLGLLTGLSAPQVHLTRADGE